MFEKLTKAIEKSFPFDEIDPVAEIESYRKEINRPIYHIHKWWAKRLGSVFRAIVSGALSNDEWLDFYSNQKFDGKVVLDPFMGSGTTLGEAAKLGAKVIGCDINPVSTFLVRQALRNVSVEELSAEFKAIEADVKNDIQVHYQTQIPGELHPGTALYYFWVKTVVTPSGEEIPLFSSYVFSKNAYTKKKPQAKIWCPACESIFEARFDAKSVLCGACGNEFSPNEGPVKGSKVIDKDGVAYKIKELVKEAGVPPKHKLYAIMALDSHGKKIYIKPSEFDFEVLRNASAEYQSLKDVLPLPSMAVRHGHNTDQARGYNYNAWRDFFSERQLLTLGLLLQRILKIENQVIRDHFVCLFSGTLEFNNMFCSFKGEGTGAVRHMFSNHILKPERTPLENSVWGVHGKSSGTFSSLFKSRLLKAKIYLDKPFEVKLDKSEGKRKSTKVVCSDPLNLKFAQSWEDFSKSRNGALILNGDSSRLPIPDCSVDAVVTDPPYFDFVHYSELSDFFYSWLSPALKSEYPYFSYENSSRKNEVQDSDTEKFTFKVGQVFSECRRVLKKDGLLCFSFHHSRVDGWMAIYSALYKAEFAVVSSHPVKAEMSVAAPKTSSCKPINLDAILVCKKTDENTVFKDPKTEIASKFDKCILRYQTIGRDLSAGDVFVIACSQAISVASLMRLPPKQARALVEWSSENCELLVNLSRTT